MYEFQTYRSRAHLSEMISLLGPPPLSLLVQEKLSHTFFDDEALIKSSGPVRAETKCPRRRGQIKVLHQIRTMLQWEPGMRSSAKELAQDKWI
ncbi:hypothetical protein N7475_006445 [Penicillium sp. IBT 31633x]|nr:hypothetical protein N7475_006445 [Penicillium sp. IBT 31633x]